MVANNLVTNVRNARKYLVEGKKSRAMEYICGELWHDLAVDYKIKCFLCNCLRPEYKVFNQEELKEELQMAAYESLINSIQKYDEKRIVNTSSQMHSARALIRFFNLNLKGAFTNTLITFSKRYYPESCKSYHEMLTMLHDNGLNNHIGTYDCEDILNVSNKHHKYYNRISFGTAKKLKEVYSHPIILSDFEKSGLSYSYKEIHKPFSLETLNKVINESFTGDDLVFFNWWFGNVISADNEDWYYNLLLVPHEILDYLKSKNVDFKNRGSVVGRQRKLLRKKLLEAKKCESCI